MASKCQSRWNNWWVLPSFVLFLYGYKCYLVSYVACYWERGNGGLLMLFNWDQHFQLSHYLESFPLDFFFHYIDNLGGGGPPSSHRQVSYWLSKDYCHDNNRSTLSPNTIKDKNHSKATLSLPPLCPHHYFSTSWSRCLSHTSWINNKIQGRCLGGGHLLSTNVKLEFRNVERILWTNFIKTSDEII